MKDEDVRYHTKSIEWGGETLTLETGKMARQADGAVVATLGETTVLATVVYERSRRRGSISFPSPSTIRKNTMPPARSPAASSSARRSPTEKETLTSRLIDRPIRPLFVPGFKNETQVICTVLSHDLENDPDMVAMIAASAALTSRARPSWAPSAAAASA